MDMGQKNKILGYLIILILLTPLTTMAHERGKNHEISYIVHPCICNCSKELASSVGLNTCSQPEIILEYLESSPSLTVIEPPNYFNWKDYQGKDWTTQAIDQGNCGSCWLCAALGALESIIQIRENCAELSLDLSEQYVLSCLPHAGSCNGGRAYSAYRYIQRNTSTGNYCNGIIPEFCFPYQANDIVDCSDKCNNWEDFLIPISDYGTWSSDGSSEDIEKIKTQILTSGPLVATMYATYYPHGENNLEEWGWEHHDSTDYYPYPGPINGANHQVVIVGWKDDPSINHGGYWIVKNSFSEEWGYDGFFNIEYGSLNIDSVAIDWVDYDPKSYGNWIPVANANGTYHGSINEGLIFDGRASIDHEGLITGYHWDFGDGTNATGVVVSHAYSQQGIYPVTLTVIDNQGNTGEDKTWAYIDQSNSPPDKPVLIGRSKGRNGTSYRYTFTASDPEGDDIYYYLVWGDTYWEGWWDGWIGPYPSGEKVTLENSWEEEGNYTVRVKAKDIYGAKSEWARLDISMYTHPRLCGNLLLYHFITWLSEHIIGLQSFLSIFQS